MKNTQIATRLVQDLYLRLNLNEILSVLKYGHYGQFSCEDINEAFRTVSSRYLVTQDWEQEFEAFVKATTYERGVKTRRCQYEGRYYYSPLWPWQKRRMKKRGEYVPLPASLPLYTLFLLIFIDCQASAADVVKIGEELALYNY